jgi:RNA polymerase sigma-70 factor (ECF subfamily)
MSEAATFEELIRGVRAWDQEAAAELVRRYGPAIRRAVRFRLADAQLGGLHDSMDICQSVLASFFIRAASGQYDLDSPEKVAGLLATMARNKLTSKARRQRALRRGGQRVTAGGGDQEQFVARGAGPSREVAARDLLEEVRRRLSPDERQLLDSRNEGLEWAAIAANLGGSADALRKKFARALDRVAEQLGLDDEA